MGAKIIEEGLWGNRSITKLDISSNPQNATLIFLPSVITADNKTSKFFEEKIMALAAVNNLSHKKHELSGIHI